MKRWLVGMALAAATAADAASAQKPLPHNVVIFVADGLRYGSISPATAPTIADIQHSGVDFADSHSLFPTLTTANASALATGHDLGDTGDFANSVYVGMPAIEGAFLSLTPFLENDQTLGGMNQRFGGNYLGSDSLLALARTSGFSTASIGKLGPVAIQDVTARDGKSTIVIDDATGTDEGLPLSDEMKARLKQVGLGTTTPDRGLNGDPGTSIMPGVHVANTEQQDWFTHVAAEVVLPLFKERGRPFVLVFWSRDPDGTQHYQGDSLHQLTPGINGPTSLAAIRNADGDLARLRAALERLGLSATTDIVVTADHGFSTISKQSSTSPSAGRSYPDVPKGFLPPGFLALDLAAALNLPVWEPNGLALDFTRHPKSGSALIGTDAKHPDIVVGANGGSDQIWFTSPAGLALAPRIGSFLTTQDYTAALFASDRIGALPGTLPLAKLNLVGRALTPMPDLIVSFASRTLGCAQAEMCAVEVSDTSLQQGQGNHGGFGRSDTRNFMAAAGPDFKRGFRDPLAVGNQDWTVTLAHVLGLPLDTASPLTGRVMTEALVQGDTPAGTVETIRSSPAANGFTTTLELHHVGGKIYPHVAGSPERTVGF